MGYKLIWEIQIKMAFLYHEGGNDAGLCRRIWWYLPKLCVQWPLNLAIPHLGFFPTVKSAHIVSESVQDYLLWEGLDGTQIKHGIFTKLNLCSCEKDQTERLFCTNVQRCSGCPVKQRKQCAKLSTMCTAFLCHKMRRVGTVCSVLTCEHLQKEILER